MSTPNTPLHFNSRRLPSPIRSYVVWLDVMGIQSIMGRSLSITANFVFKLHAIVTKERVDGVVLYPVMDGVYIACQNGKILMPFLARVFTRLADEFVSTKRLDHRFVARGALAFGQVIHGADIPDDASSDLAQLPQYRAALLLGLPMVQSHLGERSAPPFGLFVDSSARANAPDNHGTIHHVWWPWFKKNQSKLVADLGKALDEYFVWCEERAGAISYEESRIASHKLMAKQYFQYGQIIS